MKQVLTFFIWILIFLSCIFLYGKKNRVKDFKNELIALVIPSKGYYKNNLAEYYLSNNGHFVIETKVNNQQINFLFDTGASSIVLSQTDAISAGIDVNKLDYKLPISTANGISYFAYTTIAKLQIYNNIFTNLSVVVAKSGLDQSLLGMSFLKHVRSYSIDNDKLTINF
jgi:aspartyl protease family protein